jgi:hypothetical protein
MARLNTLSDGDMTEFKRVLGERISAEDAKTLIKYPDTLEAMEKAMREQAVFRLIHGRFHSLAEKIEIVKAWPGISDRFIEADFTRAAEEARDKGQLERFERYSPGLPLLDIVVVPYFGSVVETFLYGYGRLCDAFGEKFYKDKKYDAPDLEKRLALLDGITPVTNCLKVEIVDLGANRNPEDGFFITKQNRNARSAHAQVLYAAAEDPDWVRQMNPDQGVPLAFMGGYVYTEPGVGYDDFCILSLMVERSHRMVSLDRQGIQYRYHGHSLPIIVE